jgi:hypothetical protein
VKALTSRFRGDVMNGLPTPINTQAETLSAADATVHPERAVA